MGYYVSNAYEDPELQETHPDPPDLDQLKRNILASNPRVTKFKIKWDDDKSPMDSENVPPSSSNVPNVRRIFQ